MPRWGWAVLVVAAMAIVLAMASYRQYEPPSPVHVATAAHQTAAGHQPTKRFHPFYQRHRDEVRRVSDYSHQARTNRIVAVVCFLIFAFITLPKSARDVRAFYHQLTATHPLPGEAGADDEDNRRARAVLFFYLLFLLYQIVQFPLTWGRDNAVQFYSDLGFQSALMLGVIATFRSLKRGVAEHADGEAQTGWLDAKVEGLSVRWRDMSRLALGMFVGAFTPALLTKVPEWLDTVLTY